MNQPSSKKPSANQHASAQTSETKKTKKRGCGCGRNKAFEENIRQNRTK